MVELVYTFGNDVDEQLVIAYNLSSFLDQFDFHEGILG